MTGKELDYIRQVNNSLHIGGDGPFNKKCQAWLEKTLGCNRVLLTPSGTSALEMAAMLVDLKDGDEVIMPSYTFPSTANAFVLRGARIVFVDIKPETMNIDEKLLEDAITVKTKAVVVVHYAGIACEMDTIMELANQYNLFCIEDAASGMMATYKNRHLGTIGDIGCFSFHETKNYHCGEGGAILLNDMKFVERAEIIREKGTNRAKFFRKEVEHYSWMDIGASYLLSEINAAVLFAQLEIAGEIKTNRVKNWRLYYDGLKPLADKCLIELPFIPADCGHNGNVFYIKVKDFSERDRLIHYLKEKGIHCLFHYIPLHSSLAGRKYGRFEGKERWTTKESRRLLRLPMYYKLAEESVEKVVQEIGEFYA